MAISTCANGPQQGRTFVGRGSATLRARAAHGAASGATDLLRCDTGEVAREGDGVAGEGSEFVGKGSGFCMVLFSMVGWVECYFLFGERLEGIFFFWGVVFDQRH